MRDTDDPLLSALHALFVPLASLLLKNGVDTASVIQQLKIAIVDVARKEYGKGDKLASVNKVHELTGLSRSHIASLLEGRSDTIIAENRDWLLESAILATWTNTDKYLDDVGRPRALPFGPGPGTFCDLIEDVTGSTGEKEVIYYRNKFRQANCIEVGSAGRILLIKRGVEVVNDLPRLLAISLTPMATTLARNWGKPFESCHSLRIAHSTNISPSKVGTFRRISKERISTFIEEVDDVICSMESNETEPIFDPTGKELSRIGIGAYYFELEK